MRTTGFVLVTGASGGIGRELALVFAANGHDLVLVARSGGKLEALAAEIRQRWKRRVEVVAMDLTTDGAAARLFDDVAGRGIEVEILVNNAGAAEIMHFEKADPAALDRLLKLNVVVLTHLARLFVAPMVERGHGRILNVGSVSGFQATPRMAVYGATKAYVLSFSEALAEELSASGVTVTAMCPGFVNTEMVQHFAEEVGRASFVPPVVMLNAATVARQGYDACMRGRVVRTNGWFYALAVQSGRLMPRRAVRAITGYLARAYAD